MNYKNKSILYLLLLALPWLGCQSPGPKPAMEEETDQWAGMQAILDEISAPTFRDATYNITDFGAVSDENTNSLPAITQAIAKCNAEGGGIVDVPPGTYRVDGPIHLLSNVNLHISGGATIKFSTTPAYYLPAVRTRWEGVDCYNYSALIYALEQENIAITGSGTLDGQASVENWWPWCGKGYGFQDGMPSQSDEMSRPRLYQWNSDEVPVEERILGEGSYLRPNFIQPFKCKNILIDSVTIRNSPMWVMHPALSENVTITNVTVISHGPNSDGCDPESCKNVLIKNCFFDTGDDCIALKSGRNQDGRKGDAIENVVVQDCTMKDGHGGVVIGSEVSGGARNIYAENCKMDSPNLERAIRIKTNKVRGGVLENLYFRNLEVGEVKEAVVRINLRYPYFSDSTLTYIPEVKNVFVENVTSQKSKYGLLIEGYSEDHPVEGLFLKNCQFNGVAEGNKIEFAQGLVFSDYRQNGDMVQVE